MPLPFQTSEELFRRIPEGETRKILDLCAEREFPRDAAIFREGDAAEALFIVRTGLVKLTSLSERPNGSSRAMRRSSVRETQPKRSSS